MCFDKRRLENVQGCFHFWLNLVNEMHKLRSLEILFKVIFKSLEKY